MANPLIKLAKEILASGNPASIASDDGAILELGRIQTQFFKTKADAYDFVEVRQVTIENVRLPLHLQAQGLLTELVQWLAETYSLEAVQLRAVMNPVFAAKLEKSWVRQDAVGFNPSYVKFFTPRG